MTTVSKKYTKLIIFLLTILVGASAYGQKISNEIVELEKKIRKGDSNALQSLIDLSQENASASKILGVLNFKGIGLKKDIKKGLDFFEQAAKLGDQESANFLVKFYSAKNSPYKNIEKALMFQEVLKELQTANNTIIKSSPETYNKALSWKTFNEPSVKLKSYGSGFAINSSGNFVTNHHVIDGCTKLVISYNDKKAYGQVIVSSKELDLAVINIGETTPYFLSIRNKSPLIGEKIKAAGYPKRYFKFSEGIISATEENSILFQFSASISSGSSGGPVVDQSASVVGIAQGGYAPGKTESGGVNGSDFNFAIDAVYLNKLLNTNSIKSNQINNPKIFTESDIARILQKTTAIIFCY